MTIDPDRDWTIVLTGIPATPDLAAQLTRELRRLLLERGIPQARATTVETWVYADTLKPAVARELPHVNRTPKR